MFTPELESQARRAAGNAENAYAALARELVPPRGTIDVVLADNADYVNGYATPFPTNRIVLYVHPATDEEALRNYSDWNALVLTHELTHIFHLDRTRGIWRAGQYVFGRNPLLFPNIYQPSWVTEGLAVYYESRITGVGRLESGSHFMAARAAVLAREVPRLSDLATGTSRFPGGNVVYIYGSLLFDYLSRTEGPESIRSFVEKSSAYPIPLFLNHNAKSAFGISFETAWKRWRDSLARAVGSPEVAPGWRELTSAGRSAFFPRWVNDSVIWYAGNKGREVSALYSVGLDGHEQNIGRRNGLAPNTRLADGTIVFSQEDFTTPYQERTDLWLQRGRSQLQLTRGARLHSVDARRDGTIVAARNSPATTGLVLVSADGKIITPLAIGTLDLQWAEPRWSPAGDRILAVRQSRGRSAIVILDTAGRELRRVAEGPAIYSSPSWSHDARSVFFASEISGSSQLYVARLDADSADVRQITAVATGIFFPELSPDGRHIAAAVYRADGYHIAVMQAPEFETLPKAQTSRVSPRGCAACVSALNASSADSAPAAQAIQPYSVWRTLLPRYWLPVLQSSADNGSGVGAETSGSDVVGRHAYSALIAHNTTHGENSGFFSYSYAGLGMPVLGLNLSQDYSRESVYSVAGGATTIVGALAERSRLASVQASLVRPRIRTHAAAAIGAEIEQRTYATEPDTLLSRLPAIYRSPATYPAVYLTGAWSNLRRPALSISPEDGVALSAILRERWSSGSAGSASRSAVTTFSAFKSLDLPGFAHHALAVRAAAGIADERTPTRFSAGGLNGASFVVVGGYALGGQGRTFGVRGYPVGSEAGIRAVAGNAEWRAPIAAPSRGFRFFPLFVDKVSLSAFADAGRAYCPAGADQNGGVCRATDVGNPWMSSVGGEINLDTSVQLDVPARLRLGVAVPLSARSELGAPRSLLYATFGSSF